MWKKILLPLFQEEQTIKEYRREEQWVQVRNITLIAVLAFLLMSALNVFQRSVFMLFTTLGGAVVLLVCLLAGWKKKSTKFLEMACLVIFALLFTCYILMGGNDGFAVLWVVFIPFMFMMMVDVKKGLILSLYFLLLLFLVFYGPLDFLLQYDYPRMLRLRFPMLYLIDCAFSFYSVREMISARSSMIKAQEMVRQAGFRDAITGLQNRSAYMEYLGAASGQSYERLAAVYLDVNGLHELNNRLGHAAGDKMLRFVAQACLEQFPQAEVFRLGGDEFLLVSSAYSQEELAERVGRLNEKIEEAGYTVAYGVEYRQADFNLEEIVNCADAKMLQHKAEYYSVRDRRRR